jgi:flagellar motility protein MotE (MotC chaperone)
MDYKSRTATWTWPAWIAVMLSLSMMSAAAGVGSSSSEPKPESKEPVDTQELLDTQENPLRLQGPAIDMPQEVLDMLNQRQRAVERREEAMRTEEARLLSLKKDIEQLLARQLQLSKTGPNSKQKPVDAESAAKTPVDQVVKMYETMPPEEAAARLERLPTDMALEVLRSLKGKTAGTILASVKPEKAAKLTERFLAPASEKKAKPAR